MRRNFLFLFLVFALPLLAQGQISFDQLADDKVDLEALEVTKERFMAFVDQEVAQKKPGLGTYGNVDLDVCRFPVNGRPLAELKTSEGKSVRLLSNPSCEHHVLEKLLNSGYQYDQARLKPYARRRCIYESSKALRPMMEYYTIQHILPVQDDCRFCETQEKRRLNQIQKAHAKAQTYCGEAMPKIKQFLQELSNRLDRAYKAKAEGLKKGGAN